MVRGGGWATAAERSNHETPHNNNTQNNNNTTGTLAGEQLRFDHGVLVSALALEFRGGGHTRQTKHTLKLFGGTEPHAQRRS